MEKREEKIGHDELYELLTGRELSWQAIIYDLIHSEQLDPWEIDITRLTQRYIERVKELEEANFFISSKILLAAAILLRIKSELLLKRYIKSLDEILFGKPELKVEPEQIPAVEVQELLPKTPLPRLRKVTLPELMTALNKAMTTEHRRIVREVNVVRAEREAAIALPKTRINIKEKIREIYKKIKELFTRGATRVTFTQLAGRGREERIATFVPLLHLDHQERVRLQQPNLFKEIFVYLNRKV